MYKHAITALTLTVSGLLLAAGPALADDGFSSDDTISGAGQRMGFFVVDEHGIRTGSMGAGHFNRSEHQRPWGPWGHWGHWGGWGGWGLGDSLNAPDSVDASGSDVDNALLESAPVVEAAPVTPQGTGVY